jgi:hypothetical protein
LGGEADAGGDGGGVFVVAIEMVERSGETKKKREMRKEKKKKSLNKIIKIKIK